MSETNEIDIRLCLSDADSMADGWAPVIKYPNGGRVRSRMRCDTMDQARAEAMQYISCMIEYPAVFRDVHPTTNQLIDLSLHNTKDQS